MDRIYAKQLINQVLQQNGVGTVNAVGDYSITPGEFYWTAEHECCISSFAITITDTAGWEPTGFGDSTALTNGIDITVQDSNGDTLTVILNDSTSKNNAGIMFPATIHNSLVGTTNESHFLRYRPSFPICLRPGDRVHVLLQDDMSFLIHNVYSIVGAYV